MSEKSSTEESTPSSRRSVSVNKDVKLINTFSKRKQDGHIMDLHRHYTELSNIYLKLAELAQEAYTYGMTVSVKDEKKMNARGKYSEECKEKNPSTSGKEIQEGWKKLSDDEKKVYKDRASEHNAKIKKQMALERAKVMKKAFETKPKAVKLDSIDEDDEDDESRDLDDDDHDERKTPVVLERRKRKLRKLSSV